MGCANDDATGVGHRLGSGNLKEGGCSRMHTGPDGVSPQPQQQLEDLLIGLGADMSKGSRIESRITPMAQAPVLIIQKDAAIGYTRLLFGLESRIHHQPVLLLRHHIAPPYPGRYACHPREFQQSVGHTSSVITLYDDLFTFYINTEAVDHPFALYRSALPLRSSKNFDLWLC